MQLKGWSKWKLKDQKTHFFGKTQNSSTNITNINTTTTSNLNGGINNCTNAGEGYVDPIIFNACNCKEDIAMTR